MMQNIAQNEYNRRREATRLSIPVPVMLEWVNDTGETIREDTVTENLSRKGAAVFSVLPLDRGRYLRVNCSSYEVSMLATVRNRTSTRDGRTRLHLQFLHQEWPLDIV